MIKSQNTTKAYRSGWDNVFNKSKERIKSMELQLKDFTIGDKIKIVKESKYWNGVTGMV